MKFIRSIATFRLFAQILSVISAARAFSFLEQPSSLKLPQGGQGSLICRPDVGSLPFGVVVTASNLSWLRGNTLVASGTMSQSFTNTLASFSYDPQNGIYEFVVQSMMDFMDGTYYCALNVSGRYYRSNQAQLTILVKPDVPVLMISPNDGIIAGRLLKINCSSLGGKPKPDIEILQNNIPLLLDNGKLPSAVTVNSLTWLEVVKNVTREDDGSIFSCVVKHETLAGVPLRVDIPNPVDVKYTPKIILKPSITYSVEVHRKVDVSCWTIAKPVADEIYWKFKGNTISSYSMARIPDAKDYEFSNLSPNTFNADKTRIKDLIIDSVEKGQAGFYTCQGGNGLGITKTELKLNVLYEPIVTSTPEIYIKEGDDLNISCNVDSNPPPFKVTWVKKEREISINYISTSKTLYIPNVKREFTASYECRAENRLEPTRGPRTLKVGDSITKVIVEYEPGQATIDIVMTKPQNAPPNIPHPSVVTTSQPFSQGEIGGKGGTVIVGDTFELVCDTGPNPGIPAPKYKWFRAKSTFLGGPEQDSPQRFEDLRYTSKKFKVSAATLKDGGTYQCSAYNKYGEGASAKFQVSINAAPKVYRSLPTTSLVNVTREGYSLECIFTGRPTPDIAWLHNGIKIIPRENIPKQYLGSPDDRQFTYKLSLSSPDAVATSNPDPSSTASRSIGHKYDVVTDVTQFDEYLSKVTTILKWNAAIKPEDRGVYICHAQLPSTRSTLGSTDHFNPNSYTAQSQMTLQVKHQPIVYPKLTTYKAAQDYGQNAVLKCVVWSNPGPQFTWRFGMRTLSSEDPKYTITTGEQQLDGNTLYEGIINIRDFSPQDVGTYICSTDNSMGFGEQELSLHAKGKPDAPKMLAVSQVDHDSVTLTWEAGFDGGLSQSFMLFYVQGDNRNFISLTSPTGDRTESFNRIFQKRHSHLAPRAYDPYSIPSDVNQGNNLRPFDTNSSRITGYVGEGPKIYEEMYEKALKVYIDHAIKNHGSLAYVLSGLKARTPYLIWMQSKNEMGLSEPSISLNVLTAAKRMNSQDIPAAATIAYWVHNETLNFYVTQSEGLCAKITYDDPSSGYDNLGCFSLTSYSNQASYGDAFIVLPLSLILQEHQHSTNHNFKNGGQFIVQLCADYDDTICGQRGQAIFENGPSSQMTKSKKSMQSVAVVATLIPLVLILTLVSAIIFICLRRSKEKSKKDFELKASSAPASHRPNGNIVSDRNGKLPYYTHSSDPKVGTGGFVNRALEMDDGAGMSYRDNNNNSPRHFNHMGPPPYNGYHYTDHQSNGANHSESTPNDNFAKLQAPPSQNGSMSYAPYSKTLQRFRTPQDLLLAASMEDDNDLGYHQNLPDELEDDNKLSYSKNMHQIPYSQPHSDHLRHDLDRSYDDSSIPINMSETSSQRIMHEVIV